MRPRHGTCGSDTLLVSLDSTLAVLSPVPQPDEQRSFLSLDWNARTTPFPVGWNRWVL